MTRASELNTFALGDGDTHIFVLKNLKNWGPASAGHPYMKILRDCQEMNT
jgi:hypothetical protein